MRDSQDYDEEEGTLGYNYGPNELARLSQTNPEKYRRMVEQNTGLSVGEWQRRNLLIAKARLSGQQITFDGDHAYTKKEILY